jgi:hypothetical protein
MKISQNKTKQLGLKLVFFTNFGSEQSFTAPTCTTTIITLKPCALDAEFAEFHTEI